MKANAIKLSYGERAKMSHHPLAQRLFTLMEKKQTNLALSADVTKKAELLSLVEKVGPEICVLKTHIDIVEDYDSDLIQQLKKLAQKHDFLIFEDRKFSDIGHIAQLQYQKGIYRIVDWADMVTAHSLPGPGVVEGLKKVGLKQQRGLLLLAEISSKPNLLDEKYAQATVALAQQHTDFVIGFIAQRRLCDDPGFVYLTPGVGSSPSGDHLGQNYVTPQQVISQCYSDVIIVGRGIYQAETPLAMAKQFRELGWQAYLQRMK